MNIEEIEELGKKRLEVCTTCPFRKSFVQGDIAKWEKEVEDDECGLCGCPLKAKVLAMTNAKWGEGGCPKKLW